MGNTAYVYLGMGSNVGMQINLDLRGNGWGLMWGGGCGGWGVEVGRGEGGVTMLNNTKIWGQELNRVTNVDLV